MARDTKVLCSRCEARLGTGPYCPKCGYPTPSATHEDRVEWELRQWGAPNAAAMVAPTPMKPTATVPGETKRRRWFKSRNRSNGAANGHATEAGTDGNGSRAGTNGNGSKAETNAGTQTEAGPAENGNGHHTDEKVVEVSPFAPSPSAGKKASMSAAKQTKTLPAKRSAKPKPAPVAEPKIEEVSDAPEEMTPAQAHKARRTVHRLPSMVDVEAAAKQGPPMVRILRLIQLRAEVFEAQIDD